MYPLNGGYMLIGQFFWGVGDMYQYMQSKTKFLS